MGVVDLVIPAYNGGATIEACLDSVSRQVMPEGWRLQTTVVDDASADNTSQVVADYGQLEVRILTNGQNLGRARTRNVGAAHGHGEIVVFLDCDCELENQRVVTRFIQRIEEGDDCVFANVVASGDDFAARYTNDTARKRFAAAQSGDFMAMTSACFAISRSVLEEVGGFCEEYRHYGFEDRDLICTLQCGGFQLAVDQKCLVMHMESLDLDGMAEKFFYAAKFSAPIFLTRHPDAFRQSVYRKIDPRYSRVLPRSVCLMGIKLLPRLLHAAASLWKSHFTPYWIKKYYLKLICSLAYCHGSMQRETAV